MRAETRITDTKQAVKHLQSGGNRGDGDDLDRLLSLSSDTAELLNDQSTEQKSDYRHRAADTKDVSPLQALLRSVI